MRYKNINNRLNIGEKFIIVQCNQCGFNYLNPRPSESSMNQYYDIDEYHPHKLSEESLFDKIYSGLRNINVNSKRKLIGKYKQPNGNILDIGCATGEFLQSMKAHNWEVVGIERAKDARNAASRNGINIYENLNDIQDKFDIITMWHVLEHIHNVDELIKNIHRLLKDDGILFIAVPNIDSLDAKYYKSEWVALDTPRHLYHFCPLDINSLLQKHNFQLIEISNRLHFDVWYNVLLSAQLRSKIKGKNTSLLDYLMAGIIGKISFFSGLFNKEKTSSPVYIARKEN
jgi:2-polyprenyl-3-methyl-5-hydroxy-6-metoxy-1,4-benzoquinol methylase